MQQRFTKEAIDVAFKALPTHLQEVILSADVNAHIDGAIGNAHLPPEQTKIAGYLTTCTLLGLISPRTLPETLATDAGVPTELARIICASLNQTVFPLFGIEYTASGMPPVPPTPAPTHAPSEVESVVSAFRSARKDGSPVLVDALLSIHKTGAVSLGNVGIEQALVGFWNAVPTSIKNAIVDQEYKHAVRNALLGHVLSPEEVATIEEEVVMTLMGMQRKEDFAKNLIACVKGLTSNDVASVTTHIDERFFALLSPFLTPITPRAHSVEPPPVSPVAKAMGTKSPLEQFINTQPDVQTRFYKLPEEVRDVILSPEVATIFSETVRTHNLTQTQFIAYGKEVVRVMVGLATTKDFRTHVAELAVVSKETEDVFVRSVEQGMFKPVRDAIIRALEEKRSNG